MRPGRVDLDWPVPARYGLFARDGLGLWLCAVLVAGAMLPLAACSAQVPTPPHREIRPLWREYRALPGERALAVAGEFRLDRWVAGASGGEASRGEAEARALEECRKRRAQRRMQAPCLLYAVGDEVVWPRR
jgi:hypothetical protein